MIVIIGGSGFIGTKLAFRLYQSNKLFQIIDIAPSELFPDYVYRADIRYPLKIESAEKPSVIFNLAAEHRDDVKPLNRYEEVNVLGAKNVCDYAKIHGVNKIIFTSSVAVYGFAPPDTNEAGTIAPFNEYGRTKWRAEQIYLKWQLEDPHNRTLIIVRPTVVFGEGNRGNVFNLLKKIASGRFIMVGNGLNRKSMAYVDNVAAFLEYALGFKAGVHVYNYIDKPDFTMTSLVSHVNHLLDRNAEIKFRLPFVLGLLIGSGFDLIAKLTGKKFAISAIRVRKFCADSVYSSAIQETNFIPPASLIEAIEKTVCYEFQKDNNEKKIHYSK